MPQAGLVKILSPCCLLEDPHPGTFPRPPQFLHHIPHWDSWPNISSHAKDETKLQKYLKFLVKQWQEDEGRLQWNLSSKVSVALKAADTSRNYLTANMALDFRGQLKVKSRLTTLQLSSPVVNHSQTGPWKSGLPHLLKPCQLNLNNNREMAPTRLNAITVGPARKIN